MAFPKKAQMATSQYKRTRIDLSGVHITTADFMQFNVAKCIEIVPKSPIKIHHELFTRLQPLVVPTFGRANITSRAYFVPFRTIMSSFNEFIDDLPHIYNEGQLETVESMPYITMSKLREAFLNSDLSYVVDDGASDFTYEEYGSESGVVSQERKLTNLGRSAYKLLLSLGYKVNFDSRFNDTYSLAPLLCVGRIYLDWFYPSQYANDADSAWLSYIFKYDNAWGDEAPLFNADDLVRFFKIITYVSYDEDYFTSQWDNPNGPNMGLAGSEFIITPDTGNTVEYNVNHSENAPVLSSDSNPPSYISQQDLNTLRSLSDYMKRNQLAGSRVMDRYLARWGVQLSADKMTRSVYIGSFDQNIQFGDVTSMADTDGASLGSYAGKGISYGKGNFEFDTDEHGMLIIITTIKPVVGYYQGINRHCKHLTKLDFFTPEFDGMGVQATYSQELYLPIDGGTSLITDNPHYNEHVFGFIPRYAEYKVGTDCLSGDYTLNSMNVGQDSWNLLRDVTGYVDSAVDNGELVSHDYNFIKGFDSTQYNRIFYNTDNNADHFNVIHNFDIKQSLAGKSLYDTYDFENEDEAKKVSMNINGTTHN